MESEKSQTHRNRESSAGYPGPGGWGNGKILVKRHIFPAIRLTSSGNSVVTVANNTVLYTRKLLSEYILNVLTTKKKW